MKRIEYSAQWKTSVDWMDYQTHDHLKDARESELDHRKFYPQFNTRIVKREITESVIKKAKR